MSETDAARDAARSDEIDRLRRVAFGRTSTPDDERAAEAALVELAHIDAEIDAEREAARFAALPPAEPAAASVAEPVEAPHEPQPPRWRSWLAPAAVGIVAGALVASGLILTFPPAADTPDRADSTAIPAGVNYFLGDAPEVESTDGTLAGMTSTGGDLQAAERWFSDPQTDEDLEGVGSLLPEFDRESVRLVHASDIARAWVAKRVDGQLCLEVTVRETDYTSGSCALPPDFTERGLTVSSDPITVRWNGSQINLLLTQAERVE
jgi:hypothetical protein